MEHRLVAGDPEHHIAVSRLVLLVLDLRLSCEQIAADRVQRDGQHLALLVDEIIGAVGAALDHEHLLELVAIVRDMLVTT